MAVVAALWCRRRVDFDIFLSLFATRYTSNGHIEFYEPCVCPHQKRLISSRTPSTWRSWHEKPATFVCLRTQYGPFQKEGHIGCSETATVFGNSVWLPCEICVSYSTAPTTDPADILSRRDKDNSTRGWWHTPTSLYVRIMSDIPCSLCMTGNSRSTKEEIGAIINFRHFFRAEC